MYFDIHDNRKRAIINNFMNEKLKITIRDSSEYEGSKIDSGYYL